MNDDRDWIVDVGTGYTLYDGTVQIGTLKHKSQNRWLLIDRKRGYFVLSKTWDGSGSAEYTAVDDTWAAVDVTP